ncbi:MAG: AAA family ATPase, partial [Caldilineaceae bacterium]|nr:AAA family ATPase [Caldilineaceae bacterium]
MLYYLAVTGRPHTRPTLAGLLWGDQPEAAARTSLSKCLSNLHDLVGDAVLIERQTIAFNRNQPYDLDSEGFLAGIAQPPTPETIRSWQAALALYRGDFLEGFYVRDAPDFEQWVLTQRAYYREAVINGLHTLANFCNQQGNLSQAISHNRRLLTLEPWREEAHRQLMTRLARSGQRAAALAQFETCRRVLAEELAVEPDAETVALVEAILSGEFDTVTSDKVKVAHPVTRSPPHLVIPIPPTPLIGRERELAELGELISNPQCRLITITGPGGIGKTRLALAVAAEHSEKFQQGAVFVSLASISSAQFLPQAILGALDVPLQGTLSPQQQVRRTLYNQEQLLVLDNYEHLLPDVELLLDILHHAPEITLLVTSRERLALQAEYLSELTGLAYPAHPFLSSKVESVTNLNSYPASQLFLQRVRQIQPRFMPTNIEVAALVQICRKLDGIPLAIELAAVHARILPIEQIAARLDNSLNLLTAGSRTAPPRHQTLRATIDWSYDLLGDAERILLRRLSVFAGRFSLEAVDYVCGPFPAALFDLMLQLVDKSLVLVNRDGDEMHYRLLDTIREYAYEKLVAAGEKAHLRLNHLNFFTQLAETAYPKLIGVEQGHWLVQVERAHDNLRFALSWAFEQALCVEVLRLTGSLGYFWDIHGYW